MNNEYQEYFQANKKLWNEKVPVHVKSEFYNQKEFLTTKNSLNKIDLAGLPDLEGKSLLHLQCHFGQDSISLANLGADVTAVDISDAAISKAREISDEMGIPVNFVESDIYDLPNNLLGTYDVIYTSYGTICWLPELDPWAKIVADYLNAGGLFYMADFHTVLDLFEHKDKTLAFDYFNSRVYMEETDGTYADKTADIKSKEYFWNHPMSDIINALLRQGLKLEVFNEYDYSPYNCFPNMKKRAEKEYVFDVPISIPHVYELKFSK